MFDLFLFLTISTFSPGPNNLLSLHLAVQSDMRAVLKYVTGTFFGFLIVLNLTGFGHLMLSQVLPQMTLVLKYVGFAFLMYLAYKILKSSGPINDTSPPNVNWVYGFTFQFVNPKIWLAGLTVYSVYVFTYSTEAYIIFLTAFGMSMIGVMSQLTWALLGLTLKKHYNSYYKIINGIMALMLLYLALSILL